jgi:hypothetical protein
MNINDIINQEGIIYDRYLGTTLSLPYSNFDSIKIQPNETVTNFNINNIISKLYDNYLYLYKSAHVASNIIPITAVAAAGNYNGKLNWYRGLSSTQFSPISSLGLNIDLSNVLTVSYNNDLDQYALATTTGTDIIILKSNSTFTSITTALSTNVTFLGSNIPFKKIQDIVFGDNNSMYVLDLSANSIYLYDASGFLTNDNLLQNILVYQNSTGGLGTYADNTKFNDPRSIDYFNSTLYVLDKGNGCIKTYDQNLNWLLTYRLFNDFLSAGPLHLSHDSYGNNYVLNSNWTVYKYSNNFNTKEILDFTALSAVGDTVRRITFSKSDPNVFYFVTRYNIYKKLVDAPYDTVGSYNLNRFGFDSNEQFTAFTTISSINNGINYDYNFTLSNNYLTNIVYSASAKNFTNTGNNSFTVPSNVTGLTALIIAGGGSGNNRSLGGCYGGGAGGVLLSAINVTPGQVLNINVGAGGVYTTGVNGVSGQNSSIVGILTAIGGGAGGTFNPPATGGSGGGALGTGNYGTPGQGNNGGNGIFAGGGGGTGGTGGTGGIVGIGGIGIINPIPGSNLGQLSAGNYWIGGGGTGVYSTSGPGGLGGGGTGSGGNGTANTGGGGGADNTGGGGNGGSGAVVIYYNYTTNDTVAYTTTLKSGKISLFQDNLNVVSVLTNDIFDVYPLDSITIDKEEYLQNWVINKSISKLLMNHMRLRDNISSKFLYDQTTIAGDTLLAGTRYLLPNEITSIQFNQDITNFIGANEIFQNNIINRPFENILNIQTNLLSALAADVRNYNAAPQIVYLS